MPDGIRLQIILIHCKSSKDMQGAQLFINELSLKQAGIWKQLLCNYITRAHVINTGSHSSKDSQGMVVVPKKLLAARLLTHKYCSMQVPVHHRLFVSFFVKRHSTASFFFALCQAAHSCHTEDV